MKIVISTTFENLSTRVDGSVRLTFGTQELDSEAAGQVFQLRGKFCKLLISDTNITTEESELVDSLQIESIPKKHSPSKRLRGIMFRVWENSQSLMDFENWYNNEMEKIINSFKQVLD